MNLLNNIQFIDHPLNREHKIQAIIKFLRWQIGSRIAPGAIVYPWVNGSKFIVRPGETGLTGNIYCGLHEFADMAYLLHVLEPDDLFIDIGANVGSYTILACAAKKARGYCFEPVPSTFEKLMENIRINNIQDRVIALNIGLADIEGELSFTADENCMNHVTTNQDTTNNVIKVKVAKLDNILKDNHPHLLKIDVEGFESVVLKGANDILKKNSLHSVIMELNGSNNRYGFQEQDIVKIMNNNGFKSYTYSPLSREIKSLDEGKKQTGNILFIRDIDFVRERVKATPKISINDQLF